MPIEIERKFLVHKALLPDLSGGVLIMQGYLHTDKSHTVRVRLKGNEGFITIKGATVSISRPEFEYPIPMEDAKFMLENLCENTITKQRALITYKNHCWEIDTFEGENAGLQIAEIELQSENEAFEKPNWLSHEVSFDEKYRNLNLATHPFTQW